MNGTLIRTFVRPARKSITRVFSLAAVASLLLLARPAAADTLLLHINGDNTITVINGLGAAAMAHFDAVKSQCTMAAPDPTCFTTHDVPTISGTGGYSSGTLANLGFSTPGNPNVAVAAEYLVYTIAPVFLPGTNIQIGTTTTNLSWGLNTQNIVTVCSQYSYYDQFVSFHQGCLPYLDEQPHEVMTLGWSDGTNVDVLIQTPEPSSMVLLGIGLVGFAGRMRKTPQA